MILKAFLCYNLWYDPICFMGENVVQCLTFEGTSHKAQSNIHLASNLMPGK